MKKVHLPVIIMAVLFNTALFAQKDTIFTSVTQETGTMEQQRFVSEYDAVFGAMRPARWMFSSDFSKPVANGFQDPFINLGVAVKLSKSIGLGVQYDYFDDDIFRTSEQNSQFSANIRWYYNMRKRIAQGKSAPNFSGNYFSLGQSIVFDRNAELDHVLKSEVALKFGMQRRILNGAYFDVNYGISYSGRNIYHDRIISLVPSASFGLAVFTPKKSDVPSGEACDLLKCFRETRRMVKFDLYNLLKATSLSSSYAALGVNPSIAWEQKIGKSPFSVEVEGKGQFSYYKNDNAGAFGRSRQTGATAAGELRWYFLQKKHILQGHSGNNLSGVFFALNSSFSIIDGYQGPYSFTNYTTTETAVYGIQYRIFDRGFIQYKFGVGANWIKLTGIDPTGTPYDSGYKVDLRLLSELKAGFAF